MTARIDQSLAWSGRAVLFFAFGYAIWRYGGVQPVAVRDVAGLLGIAVAIAGIRVAIGHARLAMAPTWMLVLAAAWIGYGWAQSSPLVAQTIPTTIGWNQTDASQQQNLATIQLAADRLGDAATMDSVRSGSVIPATTRRAIAPWILVGITILVAPLLLDDRHGRTAFLSMMIANGSALAFWGIIQRAGGDQYILPGIEYEISGVPFASFVYKNAGATALLPVLAAAIGFLVYPREDGDFDPRETAPRIDWFSTRTLTLLALSIFIGAALIATLSRGAWVAAAVATVVTAIVVAGRRRGRVQLGRGPLIAAAVLVTAIAIVLSVGGVQSDVSTRVEEVSIDNITSDQRWRHWGDGWRTALAHFPFGSGLGTYGFASLPHHESTHTSWFQHAHNQYLETFAETGLPGSLILVIGVIAMGWLLLSTKAEGIDPHRQVWLLVAVSVFVCGLVQSLFDFVLVIPANMLVYAAILAVSASLLSSGRWNLRGRAVTIAFLIVAAGSAVWAWQVCDQQVASDEALEKTRISLVTQTPTDATIDRAMTILDSAIESHPDRAELWKRRSNWNFVAYRKELIELASRRNIEISWQNTRLENISELLAFRSSDARQDLRQELLASDDAKRYLAACLQDLGRSLLHHSLLPRTHLTCATVSSLADMPAEEWIGGTGRLSMNSAEMLFLNGWLALQHAAPETAIDQWRKSLSINLDYIEPIFQQSVGRIDAEQIATELVPPRRPDLVLRLVNPDSVLDEGLAIRLIPILENRDDIPKARRFETIARLWEIIERPDRAAEAWQTAVAASGRNQNFRYQYALALRDSGQLSKALDQASLARSIDSSDDRFDKLMAQIRRQMAEPVRR